MKNIILKLTLIFGLIFLVSCRNNVSQKNEKVSNKIPEVITNETTKIVLASEVEWTYLNPKRKDKAPMAGTLWGDRKGTGATGFLLKPKDGFSSPPHIHNVSYRGLVISGLIHNDDPNAENMWMPSGSFWTQPKGEIHITSAKGKNTIAYIEIEKGPYLVLPKEEHFNSGERPINVDNTNLVWLDASNIKWIKENNTKAAFLWEQENGFKGTLISLPIGFNGKIYSKGVSFGAVVLKGNPKYLGKENKVLETGSYFSSKGEALHAISSLSQETILYIRTNGNYKIVSN